MQIINNEQEVQSSQEPANKMKDILKVVIVIGVCLLCLGALFIFSKSSIATGKPYAIEVDGILIKPGDTVQELADSGFELSDYTARQYSAESGTSIYSQVYDLSAEVDANSYYTQIKLVKDGMAYADIEVLNESATSKPLAECKVSAVVISMDNSYENTTKVVLNGVSLEDITVDKMTEISGKPYETSEYKSYSDESPSGTEYIWKKHAYSMNIIIDNEGALYKISTNYGK